jgi:hypothetical protein
MSLVPMEKVIITMAMDRDYFPSSSGQNKMLEILNYWMPIIRNHLICLIIYYIIIEFIHRINMKNLNKKLDATL